MPDRERVCHSPEIGMVFHLQYGHPDVSDYLMRVRKIDNRRIHANIGGDPAKYTGKGHNSLNGPLISYRYGEWEGLLLSSRTQKVLLLDEETVKIKWEV